MACLSVCGSRSRSKKQEGQGIKGEGMREGKAQGRMGKGGNKMGLSGGGVGVVGVSGQARQGKKVGEGTTKAQHKVNHKARAQGQGHGQQAIKGTGVRARQAGAVQRGRAQKAGNVWSGKQGGKGSKGAIQPTAKATWARSWEGKGKGHKVTRRGRGQGKGRMASWACVHAVTR